MLARSSFLFYLLEVQTTRASCWHCSGGATDVALTYRDFENVEIRRSRHSQFNSAIASILSAYDDLIENNTRRIKILEEMAQMLYREWFVNFRFPGHEKVRMVESELGPIPEGWTVEAIGDIACIDEGSRVDPDDS